MEGMSQDAMSEAQFSMPISLGPDLLAASPDERGPTTSMTSGAVLCRPGGGQHSVRPAFGSLPGAQELAAPSREAIGRVADFYGLRLVLAPRKREARPTGAGGVRLLKAKSMSERLVGIGLLFLVCGYAGSLALAAVWTVRWMRGI